MVVLVQIGGGASSAGSADDSEVPSSVTEFENYISTVAQPFLATSKKLCGKLVTTVCTNIYD